MPFTAHSAIKNMPIITIREFGGLDICYRIAARRAHNYWEFVENIHNMFSKPWERYNAHLHLSDDRCGDRLNPSKWDSGAYFDPEFVVDGNLVLYTHFEEFEGRSTENINATNRYAMTEDNRTWYDGTYGDQGLRAKRNIVTGMDERFKAVEHNPSLAPTASLDHPTADQAIEIIDASQHQRFLKKVIVIGCVKEHWCRVSHQRPAVRAMLSSRNAVMAYIPAQYANHLRTSGEVQIPLTDVDLAKEFAGLPLWKISGAIKKQILMKVGKSMDVESMKVKGNLGEKQPNGSMEEGDQVAT